MPATGRNGHFCIKIQTPTLHAGIGRGAAVIVAFGAGVWEEIPVSFGTRSTRTGAVKAAAVFQPEPLEGQFHKPVFINVQQNGLGGVVARVSRQARPQPEGILRGGFGPHLV